MENILESHQRVLNVISQLKDEENEKIKTEQNEEKDKEKISESQQRVLNIISQ